MVKRAVGQRGVTKILLRQGEEPFRSLFQAVLTASSQFSVDPSQTLKSDHDLVLVFLHQGQGQMNGLHWAVEEVRLKPGPQATVPILLCAFEPVETIRRDGLARYGIDVLASLRIGTLRLPFLKADLYKRVTEELQAPRLSIADVEVATEAIRRGNAQKALADFIHDCRNAAQTAQGWNRIAQELFPKLEREIQQWQTPKSLLLKAERARLTKTIKLRWKEVESPFPKLFTLFQEMDGKERTVPMPPPSTVKPDEPLGWTTTVLMIEDDLDYASSIEKILKGAGHDVVLYSDSKKWLGQLAKKVIHKKSRNHAEVVLLDLNFGSQDRGFTLLRSLRASDPTIKIIMLTGQGGDAIIEAKKLGADGYLPKSVSADELLTEIEKVLVRKRIVIVDDELNAVVTPEFQRRCQAQRCAIVEYEDPDRFLADLQSRSLNLKTVDLVLLDLTYGGSMRGSSLLGAIKQNRSDLPVFMLTGRGDDKARLAVTFGEGVCFTNRDDYLVKPLGEVGWTKIWWALFPSSGYKLILCKSDRFIKLEKDGVSVVGQLKFQPKEFVLLYALGLKKIRKLDGLNRESIGLDKELREAQEMMASVTISWKGWDKDYISQLSSRIKQRLKPILGEDAGLISHKVNDDYYKLSPLIQQVEIIE